VHRVLDRAHAVLLHAAVVAGEQHRPLGERHEDRVVHLELDRQLDGSVPVSKRAASMSFSSWRRIAVWASDVEARRLEVGRQAHLQHVDLLLGRAESLRIRAAQRHQFRIEAVPDARHRCSSRAQRVDVEPGMRARYGSGGMFMIDMHGTFGLRHFVEQLAHAGRAVLRFLHGERDEIEIGGLEGAWCRRPPACRAALRIDLDQSLAALDRHAHDGAFGVDQVRFRRQADELHRSVCPQQPAWCPAASRRRRPGSGSPVVFPCSAGTACAPGAAPSRRSPSIAAGRAARRCRACG
jgi:hypothetical protein